METNEQSTNKVQVGTRLDPAIHAVVERFRTEEQRTLSQMVELLIKTHPRVQEILEAESATTAAPA